MNSEMVEAPILEPEPRSKWLRLQTTAWFPSGFTADSQMFENSAKGFVAICQTDRDVGLEFPLLMFLQSNANSIRIS